MYIYSYFFRLAFVRLRDWLLHRSSTKRIRRVDTAAGRVFENAPKARLHRRHARDDSPFRRDCLKPFNGLARGISFVFAGPFRPDDPSPG